MVHPATTTDLRREALAIVDEIENQCGDTHAWSVSARKRYADLIVTGVLSGRLKAPEESL